MRKLSLKIIAVFIIGVMAYACDELAGLVNFDGDYYVMNFTLEPTDVTGMQTLHVENFQPQLDSLLSDYGLDRESLDSVTVKEALVEVSTEGVNFDFLDSFEVTIQTGNGDPKVIAWTDVVDEGVTLLNLSLSEDEIKDFLLEDEFTLSLNGLVNTAISEPVDIVAKVKFHFKGTSPSNGFGL